MSDQNDLAIIKKVVAGDTAAFSVIVEKYKVLAITLAFNVVLSREDAEDIAQEAFIKAYLSLSSFKAHSKFSTWFYRIVLNTSLNKKKLIKSNVTVDDEQVSEEKERLVFNEIAGLGANDQKKFIQKAVAALPDDERISTTLYYLNERSVSEINELTGLTEANIKVLLYRGRKHLHIELYRLLKNELKI